MIGATKIEKVNKTKVRKHEDDSFQYKQKKKHHDKSFIVYWKRMKIMAILDTIQKQIKEVEARIRADESEARDLRELLARLKMQEFEEDLKESDGRQLLKG